MNSTTSLCMRAFSATLKFTLQGVRERGGQLSRADSHSFGAIRCPGVGKGLLKELPLTHVNIVVASSLSDMEGGGHLLSGHRLRAVCHFGIKVRENAEASKEQVEGDTKESIYICGAGR